MDDLIYLKLQLALTVIYIILNTLKKNYHLSFFCRSVDFYYIFKWHYTMTRNEGPAMHEQGQSPSWPQRLNSLESVVLDERVSDF